MYVFGRGMISFEKGISPSSENNLVNIQQNKPCPQICLSEVKKRQVVIDMLHRVDIWVIHSIWHYFDSYKVIKVILTRYSEKS